MPSYLSFEELQRRAGNKLISDETMSCLISSTEGKNVRDAQRDKEAKDPTHRWLREAAIDHFFEKGWDVHRHGVGIQGVRGVCSDLAIAKGNRVVIVECLTYTCTQDENIQKKGTLKADGFWLWLVVEKPTLDHPPAYRSRLKRFSKRFHTLVWSRKTGRLSVFNNAKR